MTASPRELAGLLFAAFGLGAVFGTLLVLASSHQSPRFEDVGRDEEELKWQGKLRAYERKLGAEPLGPG